jgi:hypothetical protein
MMRKDRWICIDCGNQITEEMLVTYNKERRV